MNTNESNPVIGPWLPYRAVFRTKFRRFESGCGIDGLAHVHDGTIEFLAIHASEEGKGQFRTFMEQLKSAYPRIRIWAVMNPLLDRVLEKYGFISGNDMDEHGQVTDVRDWSRHVGIEPQLAAGEVNCGGSE
jgi:hypothetical protein